MSTWPYQPVSAHVATDLVIGPQDGEGNQPVDDVQSRHGQQHAEDHGQRQQEKGAHAMSLIHVAKTPIMVVNLIGAHRFLEVGSAEQQAHPPRGPGSLSPSESRRAPAVGCSAGFGARAVPPGRQVSYSPVVHGRWKILSNGTSRTSS